MATSPQVEVVERAPKILPYGEKAAKFARRWPGDDKRINILEGAIRSSKTWALIPKVIQLCRYEVGGHKIFTGVSKATIQHNVLDDIFDVFGPSNYVYNKQSGELYLMDSKWLVIGAKDEGSEKYVRGITVGVNVGDELTLQPKSFVMMLLNRMSPPGARFYATTNPDNPYHYVKTDIIDNVAWRERGDLFVEHFTLDDNPNLTEDYKGFVRSGYSGVFKQRYIEGLWVVAEGAVYRDCWNEDLMYDGACPGFTDEFVAVDCGVVHKQVYAHIKDDGTTLWVDRAYCWDSTVEMRQKTDAEYADDLEEFLEGCPGAQVILPPECASFEAELRQRGMWVTDADNDVENGIRMVASLMARKYLRFSRERIPEACMREIPSYSWDPKKSKRGLEEPLKENDDFCDAIRYAAKTKVASWRVGL